MTILPEILERRSVGGFKPSPISAAKLERVLEAGRLAPSAKNRQEWRFLVVQKKALREKLQEAAFGEEKVGQAPAIIALCTTNIEYRMPNGQLYYPVDLGIAAGFMALQAVREGLGSCLMGTFDETAVKEMLSVPYSMKVVLLMLLGHPAELPEARPRKPLRSTVSHDHW